MFSINHEGEGVEHVAILRDDENGSEVRIAVGMGFNAFSFKVRTEIGVVDLLYAEEGFPKVGMRATANGTPILVPFPNRIAGGKFAYDGKDYSLPLNDNGINAIHGFAFDKPWRVVEEEANEHWARIVGEFEMLRDSEFTEEHWPGNFRVRCEYRLRDNVLSQRFAVKNLSSVRVPFGLGTHPYFRMPIGRQGVIDDCWICSPSSMHVMLDHTIPTGEIKSPEGDAKVSAFERIGSRRFDDVYTGLYFQESQLGLDEGSLGYDRAICWHSLFDPTARINVSLVHDEIVVYAVIYIPPHRNAICIEPYTCVTSAVTFGSSLGNGGQATGLWHMAPGEERTIRIDLEARAESE